MNRAEIDVSLTMGFVQPSLALSRSAQGVTQVLFTNMILNILNGLKVFRIHRRNWNNVNTVDSLNYGFCILCQKLYFLVRFLGL